MLSASRRKVRRGTETRKKSYLVTVRYSPEEFAELDELASRRGLTRPSHLRECSLKKPKTRSTRRAPIERELLAKVLGQLGKIGSNLNQVSRSANLGEKHRPAWEEVRVEVRTAALAVMDAMGRSP
jgi:hypothetical protein